MRDLGQVQNNEKKELWETPLFIEVGTIIYFPANIN